MKAIEKKKRKSSKYLESLILDWIEAVKKYGDPDNDDVKVIYYNLLAKWYLHCEQEWTVLKQNVQPLFKQNIDALIAETNKRMLADKEYAQTDEEPIIKD